MDKYLADRHRKLRQALKEYELDAFVVIDRYNTAYLTNFECTYSVLVVDGKKARFITDPRYGEMAEKALEGFEVVVRPQQQLDEFFGDFFKKSSYKAIGFEGTISVDQHDQLKKWTRGSKLKKATQVLTDLRMVKDEAELKLIRRAVKIADMAMERVIGALKPGLTEHEVRVMVRHALEAQGASDESFPCIVAAGKNSSHPHHHPGGTKLKAGDPVTIDLGGVFKGYCSDLTRTPVLGKPAKKFEEIYEICLRANKAAIKAIKPGMTGAEVDSAAREIIAEAGYGEYFGHGLGHGVGLEIHEGPTLSQRNPQGKIPANTIVTIEPGVYIPGFGGVRIEDYVLVTEKGAKVLSKAPKHLQVLPV